MMSSTNALTVEAFWLACQRAVPAAQGLPLPQAWGFGSSPQMADELGGLVHQGIKTATCSLLWEYEANGERVPKAGDLSIILNGSGEPVCLIETTGVTVRPYNEVDAGFAAEEGEGDRSLKYWREAHWHFFGRTCSQIGREISEEMPLVCERFRVLFRAEEGNPWQN